MSLWPTTRRRRLVLAAILIVGALLRLWLWWRVPDHQPANDEVEYLQVARDLLAGRGWTFYERYHWLRAPLYPLWLAASLWLARGNLVWAALPNIALGVLVIWLLYLLGREVGLGPRPAAAQTGATGSTALADRAERCGIVTAALASALLTLATFSALWMAEMLFSVLFVGALVALLRCGRRPRYRTAVLAGVLLGLAILTRSLPLTWLPLAALWMIVGARHWRAPTPTQLSEEKSWGTPPAPGLPAAFIIHRSSPSFRGFPRCHPGLPAAPLCHLGPLLFPFDPLFFVLCSLFSAPSSSSPPGPCAITWPMAP